MTSELISYKSGSNAVELSAKVVRQYLVCGKGAVTDEEVMRFIKMCEYQGLNPFLREAYLVKYGDKHPATIITGKETFVKRAVRNPKYAGHKVGVSKDGQEAWAEVYKVDFEFPIRVEVDYDEYVGMKDGKPNKMWSSKPKTMLKKVALCQALREAFPEEYGGMNSPEEFSEIETDKLPQNEIIVDGQAEVAEYDKCGTKLAQSKSKEIEKPETSKEKPEKPKAKTDEQFVKIARVMKKEKAGKTHYYIITQADTMFSTFDKNVAAKADGIKGTDQEALILYTIAEVDGKEYFNVAHGEPDEVFIIQE